MNNEKKDPFPTSGDTLTFSKIMNELEETYTSIDFKSAIFWDEGKWSNILSTLHFTDNSILELQKNLEKYENNTKKVDTDNIKFIHKLFRVKERQKLQDSLLKGILKIDNIPINFNKSINLDGIYFRQKLLCSGF